YAIGEGVALGDLSINEALRLTAPTDAQVLARAPEGPLVFAVDRPGLKALVIGFDLRASDLPWRVAFPVLFSNAFEWFRPRGAEFPGARVEAGKPYAIPLAGGDERVEVTRPSGARETLRAGVGSLQFADTIEAGFYRYNTQ